MSEAIEVKLDPGLVQEHEAGGRPLPLPAGVDAVAVFGGDKDCYRYRLTWAWDTGKATLLAAMMNPSCATAHVADGTLMWVYRWACRNGFGRLIVVNADAYRCKDQARLAEVTDPCGPFNLEHIQTAAVMADLIVVGHGKPKVKAVRDHGPRMAKALLSSGKPLHVWGLSKDGTPKHPLYLPADTPAVEWRAA